MKPVSRGWEGTPAPAKGEHAQRPVAGFLPWLAFLERQRSFLATLRLPVAISENLQSQQRW